MTERNTERLDAKRLGELLDLDAEIYVYDSCDSTNNAAKRLCRESTALENALICAEAQTAGRGRSGHSFYSPQASGLYMTVVLSPKAAPSDVIPLTTMAAVAVIEALAEFSERSFAIKWVNDIYAETPNGMRKVCGILTELETDPMTLEVRHVIIGIGINITTEVFPPDIEGIAASTGGLSTDRNTLAARITDRLYEMSRSLDDRSYMRTYIERSMVIGRVVTFTQGDVSYTATAVGIDENAALIVELEDGSRRSLNGGEISVRLREDER